MADVELAANVWWSDVKKSIQNNKIFESKYNNTGQQEYLELGKSCQTFFLVGIKDLKKCITALSSK